MSQSLHDQIQAARDRLLDLSLRNRMLNFRPTRRTTVPVVDEKPAQVWDLLVTQHKKMRFLAREERPEQSEPIRPEAPEDPDDPVAPSDEETEEGFELPDLTRELAEAPETPLPQRYGDLLLQTDLPGPALQTNLLRIDQAATSALEERGVNLLQLTLGALHWKQPDDERLLTAPLILLPVQLQRTSAKSRFALTCLSDEAMINPALEAALQRHWRIELPPVPETWDTFDLQAWLDELSRRIAERQDWQVTEEIYLTLLSFTKYLMYNDLDEDRWPPGQGIGDHALIRALTVGTDDGDGPDLARPIEDPGPADPRESFDVLDADATQLRAIHAARQGRSFVLQGPPGTGKSQTIANIVAECLAAGKTVLFVAEKRAALQVVKRRLDQLQLGRFCLELHSAKASRQAVTAEMQRTLDAPRYRSTAKDAQAQRIARLREKLDTYVRDLHKPMAPSQISPYQAIARVALLADVPDLYAALGQRQRWTPGDLQTHCESLEAFAGKLESVWPIEDHPMRGLGLTQAPAPVVRDLVTDARGAAERLGQAAGAAQECAAFLDAPAPETLGDVHALLDRARRVLEAPPVARRLLEEPTWIRPSPAVLALVELLRRLQDLNQRAQEGYHLDRLDALDASAMYDRARKTWASPLRWLRPSWWADRKLLKQIRRDEHRPELAQQIAELKQLRQRANLRDQIDAQLELGLAAFADAFGQPERDLEHLLKLADWLAEVRPLLADGKLGPGAIDLICGETPIDAPARLVDHLEHQLGQWDQAWQKVHESLQPELPEWIGCASLEEADVPSLSSRLEEMASQPDSLHDWAQFQRERGQLRQGPLSDFIDKALSHRIEPELLRLTLEKEFSRQLAEEALALRESLGGFHAKTHQDDRMRFAKLDRQWIADTSGRLRALLGAKRPDGDARAAPSSQLGILLGELRRKRGGRSIRSLLVDARQVVQTLKPCFMMSPLSVSEYLDPAGPRFDLVIFDEASQVEPADALGAVARGDQLILVGDTQQLPPTTFFSAGADDAPGRNDREIQLADMESILDRGEVVLPRLRLGWHYRSRHESLIAFSNEEFYDRRLVVFPAALQDEQLGLRAVYEPSDLYDRGRSQTNPDQARRIAQAVFRHAREHPDLSLGVGTFGRSQQQAILDAVEVLRRRDDSLEAFFLAEKPEPFFVKNLETIQGDERDVIFLSVGYGKSEPQERLSMNFGPLNQEGGWRRLNVLVTRARRQCVVFTSIAPQDFDLGATGARGVHALHRYLGFAIRRDRSQPRDAQDDLDPLARAVFHALSEEGFDVEANVGPGPFHLDLAVRDPDDPRRFLLGIECDGPGYHQEPAARDRERLRLQVLEQLGWRIARVWSVDWFRKHDNRLDPLLDAIRRARRGQLRPQLSVSAPAPAPVVQVAGGEEELSRPYVMYAVDAPRESATFYTAGIGQLAKVAGDIVKIEGPIHGDELARRLAGAWGIGRVGSRVRARVQRALATLIRDERIAQRNDFYWPGNMQTPPPRRRDDEALREADLICPEEIASAARALLEAQYGMTREDLASQTAYLLGFSSTGKRIAQKVHDTVEEEIRQGRIVEEDGKCRVAGA